MRRVEINMRRGEGAYDALIRTAKEICGEALILIQTEGFYEAFDDDAKKLAEVCDLSLVVMTENDVEIPMTGFPISELPRYKEKLDAAKVKFLTLDPQPLEKKYVRPTHPPR